MCEPHAKRRTRPGSISPSEADRLTKRLKGLDEFTPPPFLGRMERVRRRRERVFGASLAASIVIGVVIGWFMV